MSVEAFLDMDYFLNDEELDDDFGEEGQTVGKWADHYAV